MNEFNNLSWLHQLEQFVKNKFLFFFRIHRTEQSQQVTKSPIRPKMMSTSSTKTITIEAITGVYPKRGELKILIGRVSTLKPDTIYATIYSLDSGKRALKDGKIVLTNIKHPNRFQRQAEFFANCAL